MQDYDAPAPGAGTQEVPDPKEHQDAKTQDFVKFLNTNAGTTEKSVEKRIPNKNA